MRSDEPSPPVLLDLSFFGALESRNSQSRPKLIILVPLLETWQSSTCLCQSIVPSGQVVGLEVMYQAWLRQSAVQV